MMKIKPETYQEGLDDIIRNSCTKETLFVSKTDFGTTARLIV